MLHPTTNQLACSPALANKLNPNQGSIVMLCLLGIQQTAYYGKPCCILPKQGLFTAFTHSQP